MTATSTTTAESRGVIRFEVADGVGTSWITNPTKMNALSPAMLEQLRDWFRDAPSDPAIRVVVLRGDGVRAFSAGFDLDVARPSGSNPFASVEAGFREACDAVQTCPKPVVAAIRGHCLGGGLSLALLADIRWCAPGSLFGVPAAKVGIPYSDVGPLVRAVGESRAAEMLFTARSVGSVEAASAGLVQRVVDDDRLDAEIDELVHAIAANAPLSIAVAKRALLEARSVSLPSTLLVEMVDRCKSSDDLREGLRAFAERRRPVFVAH